MATLIDPAIKGIVCCLIELEREALSLGHDMAAHFIAAAQLSLSDGHRGAVNDNIGRATEPSGLLLGAPMDERKGIAGR